MKIKIPLHQKISGAINKKELNSAYIDLLDIKYTITKDQYYYYLRMIHKKARLLNQYK